MGHPERKVPHLISLDVPRDRLTATQDKDADATNMINTVSTANDTDVKNATADDMRHFALRVAQKRANRKFPI